MIDNVIKAYYKAVFGTVKEAAIEVVNNALAQAMLEADLGPLEADDAIAEQSRQGRCV